MAITFKDRVSEHPNNRKLTVISSTNPNLALMDELIVQVERNDGIVSEQGTLFSASNMNTLMVADAVIRNQAEFDALVSQFNATIGSSEPAVIAACPKTIVLVGGGGNSPNGAYTVPLNGINLPWVKTGYFHLQGINGAKLYWDCTGIEGERAAINGGVDNWENTNCTFKIENISLKIAGAMEAYKTTGFLNCTNLNNCFIVCEKKSYANHITAGFKECFNLTDCYCVADISITYNVFRPFLNCDNLINCTGISSDAYCFYECSNLINCTGTIIPGYNNTYCFYECSNLINCTGNAASNGRGHGFYGCERLINCIGKGTGPNGGYSFWDCTRASNCKDGGSTTNMWSGTNKAIDPVTCKKTPATADNSALNS